MGLDSVDLLMEFEKKFQFDLPIEIAIDILTIKDMTDYIVQLKNLGNKDSDILKNRKEGILILLRNVLQCDLKESDKISEYLDKSTSEKWKKLRNSTSYKIQKPYYGGFVLPPFYKPQYLWSDLSVSDFIDGILIYNFNEWVDFENPSCWSEIYYGVAGITADRIGVHVYEVQPHKSFAYDLRID